MTLDANPLGRMVYLINWSYWRKCRTWTKSVDFCRLLSSVEQIASRDTFKHAKHCINSSLTQQHCAVTAHILTMFFGWVLPLFSLHLLLWMPGLNLWQKCLRCAMATPVTTEWTLRIQQSWVSSITQEGKNTQPTCANTESKAVAVMPPDNWKKTQVEATLSHSAKQAGREHLWGLSNSEDMRRADQARLGWPRSCLKPLMVKKAFKFRFFKVL